MSQNTFGQPGPFGQPPAGVPGDVPAGPPLPEPDENGGRRNKLLLAGGAGLAAIVLAGAAALAFTGTSADDEEFVAAPPKPVATATPTETTPAPLPTSVEFAGRNPFKAKIVESTGGGGGSTDGGTTGGGTSTDGSTDGIGTGGTGSGTGGWTPIGSGGGTVSVPGPAGKDGRNGQDGQDGEQGPQGEKGEQGDAYVLPLLKYHVYDDDTPAEFEVWVGGPGSIKVPVDALYKPVEDEELTLLGEDAPLSWIQVMEVGEAWAVVKLGDARPVFVPANVASNLL